jgi:hypothetical protein
VANAVNPAVQDMICYTTNDLRSNWSRNLVYASDVSSETKASVSSTGTGQFLVLYQVDHHRPGVEGQTADIAGSTSTDSGNVWTSTGFVNPEANRPAAAADWQIYQ